MGFTVHGPDDEQPLLEQHCKWDNICPLVISIIPKNRSEFTKSKLMTEHYFIMQVGLDLSQSKAQRFSHFPLLRIKTFPMVRL